MNNITGLKVVVFTDLDGSLLNHNDYSYENAVPVIELLKNSDIPLVLCSSKTAAEIASLRTELRNPHPYICENGSSIFLPKVFCEKVGSIADNYRVTEEGMYFYVGLKRVEVLEVLSSLKGHYKFTGFSDMGLEGIMQHTGLDNASAILANDREASEPIIWLDSGDKLSEFEQRLAYNNARIVKGGRFYHVMGKADKGDAVNRLIKAYQSFYRSPIYSIALGDSPNDLDMLKAVSLPIVIPSIGGEHMRIDDRGHTIYAPYPGAQGWAIALQAAIDNIIGSI